MKLHHIGQVCGIVFFANLLAVSPSIASPIAWSELDKIEQRVLKKYSSKWNHYSEKEQKGLLRKYKQGIEGMRWYKRWVKSLSKKEQKEVIRQQRLHGINSTAFKKYMDLLIQRHR